MTSRYFRRLPRPTSYTMQELLEIETWPMYNLAGLDPSNSKPPLMNKDYFACRICLRLHPAQHSSNSMMKGKRDKSSTRDTSKERQKRVCIDCAILAGIYRRGLVFDYRGARVGLYDENLGGGVGVVCRKCGLFGRAMNQYQLNLKLCTSCQQSSSTHDYTDDLCSGLIPRELPGSAEWESQL